jgi:flagellar M-ring protein FliF
MDKRPTPTPVIDTSTASPLARLAQMPLRSRVMLGAGTLMLTALLAFALTTGREPEYRILYTSLSDKDGGAVIAALSQMNVPHRFSEGGAAILVPATQVHDVRLKLASQGLPKGGTVGFELMENQKFGTTQFQERLNFQRGLEGELARSIMALSAVQSARVHLALPAQTAFMREQQKPSASVLLQLYNGRTLDRGQVAGIVHLVAASVPDLAAGSVSVVDQTGALLSTPPGQQAPNGLDAPQLQYVRQTEQNLSQRILSILEPIVGAGNVRAQVTADIDFTQAESTAETYGPNQGGAPAAVRSQQLSEAPGASGAAIGGVPGALSNQPAQATTSPVNGAAQQLGAGGGGAAASGLKRDAVTNYEVDKTVKVVRHAAGTIRRLSAAILVNHTAALGADGKAGAAKGLSAAQMEQVNALVREAIGFSKDRGDSVQVVNTPFTTPAVASVPELPLWKQPETIALARSFAPWIALPLAALVVVFGFVRPALRSMRAPPPLRVSATIEDPVALGAPPAELAADGSPALLPTAEGARLQARNAQLENIRQLARSDPATVANVVRNWSSQPA